MNSRGRVGWLALMAIIAGDLAAGPLEDATAAYTRGDYATALTQVRPVAEEGDPKGQLLLGRMYYNGHGVSRDDAEAAKWARKAAEQNNAEAQRMLAALYWDGRGVPKDEAEATRWNRKAADQGDAVAQYNVGFQYSTGRGVAMDYVEAAKWYRLAAEQGLAVAQNALGYFYSIGRGVPKDDDTAWAWYRKSADQGNAEGQARIGAAYETGRSVARDDVEAAKWYRMAAEKGHALAQFQLGVMYRYGRGVARDPAEAMKWLRRASDQGLERAREQIAAIEKHEADLSSRIAFLVKAHEKSLPPFPAVEPDRVALVREIVEASATRERLERFREELSPDEVEALRTQNRQIPPQVLDMFLAVSRASFSPEPMVEHFEHKLAADLDAETLRIGLDWERSSLGRRMVALEIESGKPAHRAAAKQFLQQFVAIAKTSDDVRTRACRQADALDDYSETMIAAMEPMIAGGIILGASLQPAPMNRDAVLALVATLRTVLRDSARQGALARCLFNFRALTDDEFEQRLEFLRSASGGRYERAKNAAFAGALAQRSEVMKRTLVDVLRELKKPPHA